MTTPNTLPARVFTPLLPARTLTALEVTTFAKLRGWRETEKWDVVNVHAAMNSLRAVRNIVDDYLEGMK